MTKFQDIGWLNHLPQNADNLPDADHTEEYSWYNSAWLYKALLSNHQSELMEAVPYLRQYISNPIQLHWLLQRGIATTTAFTNEDSTTTNEIQAADIELIRDDTSPSDEASIANQIEKEATPEEVQTNEETNSEDSEELTQNNQEGSAPFAGRLEQTLKAASAALKAEDVEKDSKLPAFIPHHAIDYFEAVGVKLAATTDKDKLQSQVKSFTQWLKAMKQINYQTGAVSEDSMVTQKAVDSLKDNLIKTETMAEVLIKQGKLDAAAAIFTELQLLYPHKSAYFAARLENLKSN